MYDGKPREKIVELSTEGSTPGAYTLLAGVLTANK
jgi:hypothetical protein